LVPGLICRRPGAPARLLYTVTHPAVRVVGDAGYRGVGSPSSGRSRDNRAESGA